jgi:hypothetical protein
MTGMSERHETWQVRDNRDPQARNPWFVVFGVAALALGLVLVFSIALVAFDIGQDAQRILGYSLVALELFVRIGIGLWAWHDGQNRGGKGLVAVLLLAVLGILGWIIWLTIRPPVRPIDPSPANLDAMSAPG